jgi:hypothetical protein
VPTRRRHGVRQILLGTIDDSRSTVGQQTGRRDPLRLGDIVENRISRTRRN